MEEPIATYREVRFELRRQFEVFPDRVRIVGKGLSVGRFDGVVPLSILQSRPGSGSAGARSATAKLPLP